VIFFSVFYKVLAAICLLVIAGGFMTAPFRAERQFILLLSPACGMLTLPLLVTLFYTTDKLSFQQSAALALVLCVSLTAISVTLWRPSRFDLRVSIPLLLTIAAISTVMFCAATLIGESQSILYIDGSDHGGYAHAADWLLSHSFKQQPVLSPQHPYQSWPVVMFSGDFRYSAFVFMALMATLNGTSGLFAYDIACAVGISIACLSVAAVFASSRFMITALALFLLTTVWFELGRDGFFGKLMAYPSCLFLLGLFMTSYRGLTSQKMAAFCILALGVATMHSGIITALFVAGVGGLFICVNYLLGDDKEDTIGRFMCLAAIALVAISSNGMFSRPTPGPGSPIGYSANWADLFEHLLEIQNHARTYRSVSGTWLVPGASLALLIHVALIVIAVLRRNAIALALTAGPLLIVILLVVMDAMGFTAARYGAYQLISTIGSFGLCGAVCLLGKDFRFGSRDWWVVSVVSLSIALVMVRAPRMVSSARNSVLDPPVNRIFRLGDFDAIAAAVGRGPLVIDVNNDLYGIAALVEFGRRGIDLQWSPAGWRAVVRYRGWPNP